MNRQPNQLRTPTKPIALQLFVVGWSERMSLMERQLRRVLEADFPGRYELEIIDVVEQPRLAEEQNISLTPTLIYRDADEPRRLVGAVHRREEILWLINRSPSKSPPKPLDQNSTLADLSPDGIVLVDAEGQILSSNAAARKMLNLTGKPTAREVFGLPLTEGSSVNLILANGLPVVLNVSVVNWKGHNAFVATLRSLAAQGQMPVSASEHDAASGSRDDIALRSAVEQAARAMAALQENEKALEQSNQDLSDFAHRAAHDIKSPVLTMRQIVSCLAEDEGKALSADGLELLHGVADAADRLIKLTDELLRFSTVHKQADPPKLVDLSIVANWAINDLSRDLNEVDASYTVGSLPTVMANPMQLYQVFLNLISNAIKYRNPTRRLTLDIQSTQLESLNRISVKDNGLGFDPDHAERIFRPFERLVSYQVTPGFGIGLATVQRIIERHGGRIHAAGELDVGATFIIDLPASTQAAT